MRAGPRSAPRPAPRGPPDRSRTGPATAYLEGRRVAGERAASTDDPLEAYVGYRRQRLVDDPHVWATALYDEVSALGFDRGEPEVTDLVSQGHGEDELLAETAAVERESEHPLAGRLSPVPRTAMRNGWL